MVMSEQELRDALGDHKVFIFFETEHTISVSEPSRFSRPHNYVPPSEKEFDPGWRLL